MTTFRAGRKTAGRSPQTMSKTFAVLGAGMQGTAAAYDLARYADARSIRMGDVSPDQATKSANRVNALVCGSEPPHTEHVAPSTGICEPYHVDALSPEDLMIFLKGVDVLISCVPYWMHPQIAKIAIEAGCSMVDLGGNTEVTLETLKLDQEAKEAGVTLVP